MKKKKERILKNRKQHDKRFKYWATCRRELERSDLSLKEEESKKGKEHWDSWEDMMK